jgi:hypothetical protein
LPTERPDTLFATLFPSLLPAPVILAFRTLCTLTPPPVPTYLKWPPSAREAYDKQLKGDLLSI